MKKFLKAHEGKLNLASSGDSYVVYGAMFRHDHFQQKMKTSQTITGRSWVLRQTLQLKLLDLPYWSIVIGVVSNHRTIIFIQVAQEFWSFDKFRITECDALLRWGGEFLLNTDPSCTLNKEWYPWSILLV